MVYERMTVVPGRKKLTIELSYVSQNSIVTDKQFSP